MMADPRPIIYLGSTSRIFTPDSIRLGLLRKVRFMCLSYYDERINKGKIWKLFKRNHVRAFLDSGAFTYHQQWRKNHIKPTEKEIDAIINEYVQWVLETPFSFDFAITFDYAPEPEVSYKVTKYIQRLGLKNVIPVFHNGSSLTWLERFIDEGHSLIGISKGYSFKIRSLHRPFWDQVFNITEKRGVRCHGLACTGDELFEYPWYSVDSTSWINSAAFGQILVMRNGRLEGVPVSSKAIPRPEKIIDAWYERAAINADVFWELSKLLTKRNIQFNRRSLF